MKYLEQAHEQVYSKIQEACAKNKLAQEETKIINTHSINKHIPLINTQ